MPSSTPRNVVLDTDAYNEIDDQFALTHLLLSPGQVNLEAVYAAPFFNSHSTSAGDGMEKSYNEIFRVLDAVEPLKRPPVFRGSSRFMGHATDAVASDAVKDLVERAMKPRDGKLYVLAIGAPTTVASALLTEPRIAENIVVVWLGGHAPCWRDTREFNLRQDLPASRIILEARAPLVLIPCYPVASHLIITQAELEANLAPLGKGGAYLTTCFSNYLKGRSPAASRSIWDMAASAWAIENSWVPTNKAHSPEFREDLTWETKENTNRPQIDIAWHLDRDRIFDDLYTKVQSHSASIQ